MSDADSRPTRSLPSLTVGLLTHSLFCWDEKLRECSPSSGRLNGKVRFRLLQSSASRTSSRNLLSLPAMNRWAIINRALTRTGSGPGFCARPTYASPGTQSLSTRDKHLLRHWSFLLTRLICRTTRRSSPTTVAACHQTNGVVDRHLGPCQ